MLFRRWRKTYLEGIMEGRLRERRDAAHRIRAYAEHETQRLGWDGMGGMLGNWIAGIRDAALVVEGTHPYFPSKPEPPATDTSVCTCGKVYPSDQDPHPWNPQVGGS